MLKSFTILLVILAFFTVVSLIIPDRVTGEIDAAIVYFLGYIYQLDSVIDISVFFACAIILINFYIGVMIFWIFHWMMGHVSGTPQ